MIRIRRALLATHDKSGLADFARALVEKGPDGSGGVELLSTGGTGRALREAGLPVTRVADVTGFPEMFGGRVKTLHPRIHGGILFRRDHAGDCEEAERIGLKPIELVVVNLYPFEATVAREGVTRAEAVEQIDIGGPAMIRAAAKNHEHVVVVVDPASYETVLSEIAEQGGVRRTTAARLATEAFRRTADYDRSIADWLARAPPEASA